VKQSWTVWRKCPNICLKGLKKTKNACQNSQTVGPEFSTSFPEYAARVLATTPQYMVFGTGFETVVLLLLQNWFRKPSIRVFSCYLLWLNTDNISESKVSLHTSTHYCSSELFYMCLSNHVPHYCQSYK